MTIEAYGGELVDRVLEGAASRRARERADGLPRVRLSDVAMSDLYLLAVGGFSPLTGFMGSEDYEAVLEEMTLVNGLPWTVPVTLAVGRPGADGAWGGGESAVDAGSGEIGDGDGEGEGDGGEDGGGAFGVGDEIALVAPDGDLAAVMLVEELYGWDRDREAERVYGTTDRAHPGVARLDGLGDTLVAGPIEYVYEGDSTGFPSRNLTPAETRAAIDERGWDTVVAFQTRNPVHRAHEYLQKCALEIVDGLLLHPLVGDTKEGDVPADVRMECYETILEHYYPEERVLLSVLPAAMRYAGPREAVFHAIMRRNYGCTHFIVGRDHAGVGDYYGTYEAQEIFEEIDGRKLGIRPLTFEHAFFCTECDQMATKKTCPHAGEHHIFLSGTKVRAMLARGERPPAEFSRPEVADVLVRAYAGEGQPA